MHESAARRKGKGMREMKEREGMREKEGRKKNEEEKREEEKRKERRKKGKEEGNRNQRRAGSRTGWKRTRNCVREVGSSHSSYFTPKGHVMATVSPYFRANLRCVWFGCCCVNVKDRFRGVLGLSET